MCMYCKCNDLMESTTTHVVNYKGYVIIVKKVPCEECEQCGAKYQSDETARQLGKLVNKAKELMQEISVINYTEAAQFEASGCQSSPKPHTFRNHMTYNVLHQTAI